MKFNTAIESMMAKVNTIYEVGKITKTELMTLSKVLSPFAPHVAEEVYELLGCKGLVSIAKWPEYDEAKCGDDVLEMPVQINGKVRTVITVQKNATKDDILSLVRADEKIKAATDGKTVVKEIIVPGKIINIVLK